MIQIRENDGFLTSVYRVYSFVFKRLSPHAAALSDGHLAAMGDPPTGNTPSSQKGVGRDPP